MPGRSLLAAVLCATGLFACGSSKKSGNLPVGFSQGQRGERAYPAERGADGAPKAPPPSRVVGSSIEPIGALLDAAPRLEEVTLQGLAAKGMSEVSEVGVLSGLGQTLRTVFGEGARAIKLFEAPLRPTEFALASVRLEPERCYGVAAAAKGLEGLRVHLVSGPPWPPTVIAQSSLLLGAGSLTGANGCLRSPDAAGVSVYIVVEATGGEGKVALGLYELRN